MSAYDEHKQKNTYEVNATQGFSFNLQKKSRFFFEIIARFLFLHTRKKTQK